MIIVKHANHDSEKSANFWHAPCHETLFHTTITPNRQFQVIQITEYTKGTKRRTRESGLQARLRKRLTQPTLKGRLRLPHTSFNHRIHKRHKTPHLSILCLVWFRFPGCRRRVAPPQPGATFFKSLRDVISLIKILTLKTSTDPFNRVLRSLAK
jgi:hypothetical protein